jgi:plasmid stabilization system protein ParE
VEVRFHRRVQADLNEILGKYYEISNQLAEDFFAEFEIGIRNAAVNPGRFHFDRSGLRRCNLERFPYHFLYDIRGGYIRIWVLRHDRRNPDFGLQRFSE